MPNVFFGFTFEAQIFDIKMIQPDKKIIIAIDGYSSSGKSTLAKEIAKLLTYKYIDSGAMYRAVTLFAIRNHIINKNHEVNEAKLKELIDNVHINFQYNSDKKRQETYLNNENVEDEIREMEVSNSVSFISKIGFVRKKMVSFQQEMGKEKGIVMDGRDIGTVVFPDAELKIFMNAKAEVRAERRYLELKEKNVDVSFDEILDDAVELDNSHMNRQEQLDWIVRLVKERIN